MLRQKLEEEPNRTREQYNALNLTAQLYYTKIVRRKDQGMKPSAVTDEGRGVPNGQ